MPIQFRCAGCSQPIEVDDQFAGRSAQCPYCQRVITVPPESTLDSAVPTAARPASGVPAPPPVPTAPPPLPGSGGLGPPEFAGAPWRPTKADPREGTARSFGNYALIFVGLAVGLMLAQMIISFATMTAELARLGTTTPTPEQMQGIMQKLAMEKPVIPALGFGSLFFGVLGLILGIVSWRQWPAANWRAWLSMSVGGLFLLCICGAFAFTLLTSGFGLSG